MSARYRHEDVEAVPKGWKVRTVKAGSHRVRVAFPPGRRQKGSGRLVSVLHPLSGSNPCANPCSLRSTNPAELMVMGANPPRRRNAEAKEQRVFVRHQIRIAKETLRMPDQVAAAMGGMTKDQARAILHQHGLKARENSGVSRYAVYKDNTLHAIKRSLQAADKVAARLRDHGHSAQVVGPRQFFQKHLGQNPAELIIAGANPRVEVVHSANPPAEDIVEDFTGQQAEYIDVYNEPHMPRGRYAQLGPLIALYIKPAKGGQVQRIGAAEAVGHDFPNAWGGKPPIVVSDSSARQIYFVDGSQDLTDCLEAFGAVDKGNGLFELGQARRIDYQCRKEHVASPDEDLWKHEHGEENGVLPTVLFDKTHKRILYEGGDYRIEGPWIRN